MELKASSKKRFFVRVNKSIKEELKDLDLSFKAEKSSYKLKSSYDCSFASYEEKAIDDYIVNENECPTFSRLVKKIME